MASQFNKTDKLSVKGSIIALIGSNREEKTVELKVGDKKRKKSVPTRSRWEKATAGCSAA